MKPKTKHERRSTSNVWTTKIVGKGEPHSLYAPRLFFKLWLDPDLKLKTYINEYLVSYVNSQHGGDAPELPTRREVNAKTKVWEEQEAKIPLIMVTIDDL